VNVETSVDWIPALAILGAGVIFGAVLVWRLFSTSRRPARASSGVPAAELRDLAGRSEVLLRQLRELEDTASKRNPEQLARERYGLELEAAQSLLALEARGVSAEPKRMATVPKQASAAVAVPTRAGLRGFLWGVGSAAGVLLLFLLVYQSAKPREPGGSVTGNTPMTGAPSASTPPDAAEAEIQATLARDPDNLDAHLALARLYVERQNWMAVWNETGKVLERAPGNAHALAYQSLVRLAMGQTDGAVTMLTKALASDPDLLEGYAYLALAHARAGRMGDAEAVIAKASKRFPERAPELRRYLADLKQQETAVTQAGPGATDPHPGVGMPAQGAPAPAARAGRRVSGTVDIDPALRGSLQPGAILFVFARAAGAASEGPPVAVKRLPAVFPAAFELGESDSMMGQPLPDRLLIEARLDSDGDPTTRPPTDPKARLDQVKTGRTDVRLLLKKP
jgi:cytochrome c-type biogenesis protein CcmH